LATRDIQPAVQTEHSRVFTHAHAGVQACRALAASRAEA